MKKCPNCGYIESSKSNRSNNQNRYYWGIVLPVLSQHTGHSIGEMHELMKTMFLRDWIELKDKRGNLMSKVTIKSSTELDTKEFELYMSKIREWASDELHCYIPEPNETPEEK